MILLPTATIKIQKAGLVSDTGDADFFVLPVADQSVANPAASQDKIKLGIVSACDVEFSTTADATATTTTFEVVNLHPNVVRQMAEAGYVKIEAGYVGHPDRPPQVIFFGILDTYKYRLSSGKIKWTFTATAFPNDIWAIKPNASQFIQPGGVPVPIIIGEAVRVIADRIGIGRANVSLPKIFDGDLSETDFVNPVKYSPTFVNAITLDRWTTTRAAIFELQDLMKMVSQAVLQTFGVVRNYSLLPDVNNPFRIVIDDMDKFTGESLVIDLDSNLIIDAGPAGTTNVAPALDTETDGETTTLENPVIQLPEYQVVSVFDPKVAIGLTVTAHSEKLGLEAVFKVKKGKHTLNGSPLRWRTEYSGELKNEVTVGRGS